ncbi:hypothetical protein PR003_g29081 [Phytophthora rubi]|uniref:Uncharacterized protein n=1 Tax=Phytophthora rubi TaxID=129364 RepID=A0A6A3GYI6_9STRA|nr:hypothetical protein PR002_g29833 [Phytophthora rubi]KAE8961798.1 hypothetical protein PR001_g29928 [Phytophthora rubi]KAE9276374.1 hypothetical protein PR003_g29081 [Phytophthora rubi]
MKTVAPTRPEPDGGPAGREPAARACSRTRATTRLRGLKWDNIYLKGLTNLEKIDGPDSHVQRCPVPDTTQSVCVLTPDIAQLHDKCNDNISLELSNQRSSRTPGSSSCRATWAP